jgi:hypothetical protein
MLKGSLSEMGINLPVAISALAVRMSGAVAVAKGSHKRAALNRTSREPDALRIPGFTGNARLKVIVSDFCDSREDKAGGVSPRIGTNFPGPSAVVPWHADRNVHGGQVSCSGDHWHSFLQGTRALLQVSKKRLQK